MFYWIQIRLLWRPFQSFPAFFFKYLEGWTSSVFWVVVMLEDHMTFLQLVPNQGILQRALDHILVLTSIHSTTNQSRISRSTGCHASPNHDATTTILSGGLDHPIFQRFSSLLPAPFLPVWSAEVNFGLVRPNNPPPVLLSPGLMLLRPVQSGSPMFLTQHRLRDLPPCLESRPFEDSSDSVRRHCSKVRLSKKPSDIFCRIQCPGSDETESMATGRLIDLPWTAIGCLIFGSQMDHWTVLADSRCWNAKFLGNSTMRLALL